MALLAISVRAPPVGDKQHHYHFQILALDRMLDIPPGADRDQVLAAAEGIADAYRGVVRREGRRAS